VNRSYASRCRHVVEFYGRDPQRSAENVARYLAEGLGGGGAALVIAEATRRAAIVEELERLADLALVGDRLVLLDDCEMFDKLTRDGRVDAALANEVLCPLLRSLTAQFASVRAYGEIVGTLWAHRAFGEAIALERIWNEILTGEEVDLYCGYPIDVLGEEFQMPTACGVLAEHDCLLSTLDAGFDGAIRRAVFEVLGDPYGSGVTAEPSFKWLPTTLPRAEGMILRLRSALPRYADEILAKAQTYA
jgi:hypothetical protein